MAFWESKDSRGSFVVHFTAQPERDFGAYARGYASAARCLAQAYLARGHADYEAYPVVFLYRHALELYLKNIIVKGLHLAAVRGTELLEEVTYTHDLARLFGSARAVLLGCLPGDEDLSGFLEGLDVVVRDFALLDMNSFTFRYPVNKKGVRPVSRAIHGSVLTMSATMDALLDELDNLDVGLDIESDLAEEALSYWLHDFEDHDL